MTGFVVISEQSNLLCGRFGSTVPGLVQIGDGGASQPRRRYRMPGPPDSIVSQSPDGVEDLAACLSAMFGAVNRLLNLSLQSVQARVGISPRVDKSRRVELTHQRCHIRQLQQLRAGRNQQADSELNRRDVVDEL